MGDHTPEFFSFQVDGYTFRVDWQDRDLAERHWWVSKSRLPYVYIFASFVKRPVHYTYQLHRTILERMLGRFLVRGELCDHKDGDTLNCQRSNLRLATKQQNQMNQRKRVGSTNPYKGVHQRKSGRFSACIYVDKRKTSLGTFDTAEEAYEVYKAAALEHYGEFARFE